MNKQFSSVIGLDNPIIRNHLVNGQALLPELAYIDMLFQIAQANGFDVEKTVLKNVSIFNPLLIRDDLVVELTISFLQQQDYWKIVVEGTEKRTKGAGTYAQKKYISAQLYHDGTIAFNQTIDIEDIKSRAKGIADMEDDVYAQARKNGWVHQAVIKADGKAYLSDGGGLFHLAVPTNYIEDAKDYIFHPALLDGSSMAAAMLFQSALPGKADYLLENLCRPIFYEAFFASEALRTQCYARVQTSSVKCVEDTIHFDIEFFNQEGKKVGVLKRLTLKLIRSDEQINTKNAHISFQETIPNVSKEEITDFRTPQSLNVKDLSNDKLRIQLMNIFAKFLRLRPHQINTQTGFIELGIESAKLLDVLKEMEDILGTTLSPTLLFEYTNIDELVQYFSKSNQVDKLTGQEITEGQNKVIGSKSVVSASKQPDSDRCCETDIAIIGLSGRYPQATNIQELWEILKGGKDCVTEIPKDRWDYNLYYDEDKNKPGKTCSKWGSFIDDVDKFDPLFFNVLPKYATFMDPQERLFLECVWNLLESIGYTQDTLQQMYRGQIGVYVGARYLQYHSFNSDLATEAAITTLSGSIANRVSYFFNFQGPSVAIDTMCSSSGTAIHLACESLLRGECQAAIAGGVNLSIHPKKYVGLSQAQMLASRPDCRSFGDGDGYVAGEGVGAVLLKPLSKALQDKDQIMAIIKSTTTNHGGRGNAYAVPNGNAQVRLIEDNLIKSGMHPRTISYVEAAANGSALGDPIELGALTRVFREYTPDRQFCAIGSVKSNLGHTEVASGITQLTKVVLQLQHQQLVPSIKADPLNPNINFETTPFYLQRELQEWKRPVLNINGEEREYPRRATISAFGAGGSNAHIIVEEFIPDQEEGQVDVSLTNVPQVVIFSAKNQERLLAVVEQMLEFLAQEKEFRLADFAYTLQVGRQAMESRLAMIVSSHEEVMNGLKAFINAKQEAKEIKDAIPIFTWDLRQDDSQISSFLSGNLGDTVVQLLLAEKNLEKIAIYWTQGGKIPWEMLHEGQNVRKIALPTYPFARERYWVSISEAVHHQSNLSQQSKEEVQIFTTNPNKSTLENIQEYIVQILSKKLYVAREQIDFNKNIYDFGIDSVVIMSFMRDFEKQFETKLTLREMLEHQTFNDLSSYLANKIEKGNKVQAINDNVEQNHQETSEHIDEEVVKALEKLAQGELGVREVRNLLEGGREV